MNENLSQIQYDVTKKHKIIQFYEKNKILIYSAIAIIVISFASINFYLSSKEEKNILIAENYINAKIQIQNENKVEAIKSGVPSIL